MNRSIHSSKRFFQRIGIGVSRYLFEIRPSKFTPSERDILIILRKLLRDPDTELMSSPSNNKCYIKNRDNSLLLILNGDQVSMINNNYGYDIQVSKKVEKILFHEFLSELVSRTINLESMFNNNIEKNLKKIISHLHEAEKK